MIHSFGSAKGKKNKIIIKEQGYFRSLVNADLFALSHSLTSFEQEEEDMNESNETL